MPRVKGPRHFLMVSPSRRRKPSFSREHGMYLRRSGAQCPKMRAGSWKSARKDAAVSLTVRHLGARFLQTMALASRRGRLHPREYRRR
jgi:hypothetical protein